MIAVALAGVALGGWVEGERSRERFETVEQDHLIYLLIAPQRMPKDYHPWHPSMASKYRFAARFPWLPVGPDPPEPET